jgi:hypothetical protein
LWFVTEQLLTEHVFLKTPVEKEVRFKMSSAQIGPMWPLGLLIRTCISQRQRYVIRISPDQLHLVPLGGSTGPLRPARCKVPQCFHLTVFPSLLGEHSKTGKTRFSVCPHCQVTAYSVNVLLGNNRIWETWQTLHRHSDFLLYIRDLYAPQKKYDGATFLGQYSIRTRQIMLGVYSSVQRTRANLCHTIEN